MKKLLPFLLLFFFLAPVLQGHLFGQCAMCKATIEANSTNSGKYGVGLNTGILYLMSVPYLAAMVIGFFWYRNARKPGKGKASGKLSRP